MNSEINLEVSNKRYIVSIESPAQTLEVPIYAETLEEADKLATAEYAKGGYYKVTRVRPANY